MYPLHCGGFRSGAVLGGVMRGNFFRRQTMRTETTQTIVTRELVPEDQRLAVTEKFFGSLFPLELEPFIYGVADRLAEDYKGGYWDFFTLSNSSFYMTPSDDRTYYAICDNFYEGNLSSDAFGLTSCLYAYSHLSFAGTASFSHTYADMYHKLRQFMLDHPDAQKILASID
jgi:hypothetical protein